MPSKLSFSDLFRLVKADTQQTMLSHPVALLRQFAQFPFIAEKTQVRRRLAPRVANAPPPPPPVKEEEAVAWKRLEAQLWPVDVLSTAEDYLKSYPDSPLLGSAQVARDGAAEAVAILRRSNVRLYRSAFQALADLPPERAADILKAGRGDKDAAARLGRHYKRSSDGSAAYRSGGDSRYEGWMQYASALGNGIASYDLSLYYRRVEQPQLASEYETRARTGLHAAAVAGQQPQVRPQGRWAVNPSLLSDCAGGHPAVADSRGPRQWPTGKLLPARHPALPRMVITVQGALRHAIPTPQCRRIGHHNGCLTGL